MSRPRRLLGGWGRYLDGRCFEVVGEAGIGKSRLPDGPLETSPAAQIAARP